MATSESPVIVHEIPAAGRAPLRVSVAPPGPTREQGDEAPSSRTGG